MRFPAEAVFAKLFAGRPWAAWLDSAGGPGAQARYSVLASDPAVTFTWKGASGVLRDAAGREERLSGDPFERLRRLLRDLARPGYPRRGPGPHPFEGGAVGYFAYDLGRHLERLPSRAVDDTGIPDCALAFYPAGITVDHRTGEARVWSSPLPGFEAPAAEREAALLAGLAWLDGGVPDPPVPPASGCEWNFTREGYLDAVTRARESIAAGDIYQVNLSRRLRARWRGDPLALYLRLRRALPEPYAAFLGFPGAAVLCASPELFLSSSPGGRVVTRPIKGTRPRGAGRREDARLRRELLTSAKDAAELLMIVDLERNDLAKVCRPGSVRVPRLRAVESHPAVHHLVATVSGRLRPGLGPVDLLRAAFPGGSITGAPKVRAMEIIEELEPVRRGVYTGALGWIGFDGSMKLNIVIRTLVAGDGWVDLQVGGGIVADSDPEREYEETRAKAKGLLDTLGLA